MTGHVTADLFAEDGELTMGEYIRRGGLTCKTDNRWRVTIFRDGIEIFHGSADATWDWLKDNALMPDDGKRWIEHEQDL